MKMYEYFSSNKLIVNQWLPLLSFAASPTVSTKWIARSMCPTNSGKQQQLIQFRFLLFELHGWPRFIYTNPHIHTLIISSILKEIHIAGELASEWARARAHFQNDRMAYIHSERRESEACFNRAISFFLLRIDQCVCII